MRKNILILGGAFAGLQAARGLNPRHFRVTVVDRSTRVGMASVQKAHPGGH